MLATELPSPCFSSFNPYIDLREIKRSIAKGITSHSVDQLSSNVSRPHPELQAIRAMDMVMILKVSGLCVEWDGGVILSH